MSPSIKAAADGVAVLTNTMFQILSKADPSFRSKLVGRYGQLSPGRQIKEVSLRHIPALKALYRWYEEYAYPEAKSFDSARSLYFQWKRENDPQPSSSQGQLNPDYLRVFEALRRGDLDQARVSAGRYYKRMSQERVPLDKAAQNLRASLLARRPIPVSDAKFGRYINWLPKDRRSEIFRLNQRYESQVNLVAPRSE
jgi:hypothetical protein